MNLRPVKIRVVWTPRTRSRLLEWLLFLVQVCVRLPVYSWDRCVILTDPPFLVASAIGARLFGRRRIYWWTMDLYPEAMVAQGMIVRDRVVHRVLSFVNEMALQCLAGVICLGERQRLRLAAYSRWPTSEPGFAIVVPPWDHRPMPPVERGMNRFLAKFCWQAKNVALYARNLGEAHVFEEIIAGARVLVERGEHRWQFVFVVRGANRRMLEAAAQGVTNVAVLDYQPEDLTSDMLWAAHVHLITMREGWEGVVVPTKFYGTLQTQAPILFVGPSDSETATEIRSLEIGECLDPGASGEQVVAALQRLEVRGRVADVSAPSDGPQRIVQFVCGSPANHAQVLL